MKSVRHSRAKLRFKYLNELSDFANKFSSSCGVIELRASLDTVIDLDGDGGSIFHPMAQQVADLQEVLGVGHRLVLLAGGRHVSTLGILSGQPLVINAFLLEGQAHLLELTVHRAAGTLDLRDGGAGRVAGGQGGFPRGGAGLDSLDVLGCHNLALMLLLASHLLPRQLLNALHVAERRDVLDPGLRLQKPEDKLRVHVPVLSVPRARWPCQ